MEDAIKLGVFVLILGRDRITARARGVDAQDAPDRARRAGDLRLNREILLFFRS